ncbi:hypothetical protein HY486_03255 [Candidatus Woesearchaeota archaeon]|nr:hypothetical protein [Candidatus Woesearchaeota archaeon]
MFKTYGIIGLLLIIIAHINYFFDVQPFAHWYFAIIWVGYILLIDSIIFQLKHESMLTKRKAEFAAITITSILIWWIFELLNLRTGNWGYNSIMGMEAISNVGRKTIMYATMLPAFFETVELFKTLNLFSHSKLKKKHNITKPLLHTMKGIGIICLLLPLLFPKIFFPLIWLAFYFILDPVNYLHKQPSIIQHIKDRKLQTPFILMLAGITMGVLWEAWNYYAVPSTKWHYNIPYLGFFKIFEMPILGYLGYLPFSFELYAMYFFIKGLFEHKEKLLE